MATFKRRYVLGEGYIDLSEFSASLMNCDGYNIPMDKGGDWALESIERIGPFPDPEKEPMFKLILERIPKRRAKR
jgi:hypothetical protein